MYVARSVGSLPFPSLTLPWSIVVSRGQKCIPPSAGVLSRLVCDWHQVGESVTAYYSAEYEHA